MAACELYTISEEQSGMRLDRVLRQHYSDTPYTFILKLIRKGEVRVNSKRAKQNDRVNTGDEIRIPPSLKVGAKASRTGGKPQGTPAQYKELIEDNIIVKHKNFFAINKPPGLSVQGGSKVGLSVDGLLSSVADNGQRPYLVHRLDKDTSGVLVLAYDRKQAGVLADLFKQRDVKKCYLALVIGTLPKEEGVIKKALAKRVVSGNEKMVVDPEGKKSVTYYRVLDQLSDVASLVAFYPETGRKHQLRVHAASVGCPIVGDFKYGGKEAAIDGVSGKLHLHAYELELNKEKIQAPLPHYFKESVDYLGLSF